MASVVLPAFAAARASEDVRAEVGLIPAVEGFRGLAVLWVVSFHYFVLRDGHFDDAFVTAAKAWAPVEALVRNGYLGVDLFFVITGFLLTLPWFRHAMQGRPAPLAGAFYARRMRRILPAYYVHLVILFFVVLPLILPAIWIESTPFVVANLGAHAMLLHYTTPLTSSSMTVNGALWTLAIEAQYYALVPLVAPCFVKWPWRSLLAAALLAAGWRWFALNHFDGLVGAYLGLGAKAGVTEPVARHLLETQLPAWSLHFALGIIAGRAWLMRPRLALPQGEEALLVAVALACASLLVARLMGALAFLGQHGWVVFPLLIAGLFAAVVAAPSSALSRLASAPPLAMLGRISYSTYLYHLPLLLLFNAYLPRADAGVAFVAWMAAVLAASAISYRFVELPYVSRRSPWKA